jgi:transglutaminase-like putative cysteine protease
MYSYERAQHTTLAAHPTKLVSKPTLKDVVEGMRSFAHKGKGDMKIRDLVEQICSTLIQGDYASEVLACYYWVCQHIRYLRDPYGLEFVKEPARTLESRAGDCDDIAVLLAAMAMTCGNRCRFVLVGFKSGGQPSHVYLEVLTPHGPVALDPVANRETARMQAQVKVRIDVPV